MEAAVDMHDHLVASQGDGSALVKFWKIVLECCVCFAEALLLLYAGAIHPPTPGYENHTTLHTFILWELRRFHGFVGFIVFWCSAL